MTSAVRIVLTNGSSQKCKIIGQRLSWLIVRRKRRKVYYPINQIRSLNYRTIEEYEFEVGIAEPEVSG